MSKGHAQMVDVSGRPVTPFQASSGSPLRRRRPWMTAVRSAITFHASLYARPPILRPEKGDSSCAPSHGCSWCWAQCLPSAVYPPRTALRFDGISSYATIPASAAFSVSPMGLTVSVLLRPDARRLSKTEGSLPTEQFVHWLGKGEVGRQEWTFRMYSGST